MATFNPWDEQYRVENPPDDVHAKVLETVNRYRELANERITSDAAKIPETEVLYVSIRDLAGMSNPNGPRIALNRDLLEINPTLVFTDTIPHEMAHLAAFARTFDGQYSVIGQFLESELVNGHGSNWETVMRDWFGLQPRRFISPDVIVPGKFSIPT